MNLLSEHRARAWHRAFVVAAWIGLAAIAFATLSPIGLRPQIGGANFERLLAYTLVGGLFGLAYPRHLLIVALVVAGFAIGLELLQLIIPGRHGVLMDAVIKTAGGLVGVAGAAVVNRIFARLLRL